jgi:hypothetical protein
MTAKLLRDPRTIRAALIWAGVYTGMTIGWALLGQLFGMYNEHIAHSLAFNTAILVPSLAVYTLAIRNLARGRATTYGQRLLLGLLLTVFVTVLGPLYPLASTVISPQYFENAIRYTTDSGMMSEADARQQLNLTTFVIQGLIAAPIFGLLLSAIGAIFNRASSAPLSAALQSST